MSIKEILQENKNNFARVIDLDYHSLPYSVFDLTDKNQDLQKVDLSDVEDFHKYLKDVMKRDKSFFGIGRYNENRTIYNHSDLFDGEEEARTLHLGIDLWVDKSGVNVFAPLGGMVHSFNNNEGVGDYGPTIILEHSIKGEIFYTLFGHLDISSLLNMQEGQQVKKGEKIGSIGCYPENGNWPPHLHFEIILDMQDKKGDFPGVAKVSEREYWLKICPDPNLILNIEGLNN